MAPVADYSTTAGDNTSISGLAVSDSTVIDTVDNIIRQLMADVRAADDENAKTAATETISGTWTFTASATFGSSVTVTGSMSVGDTMSVGAALTTKNIVPADTALHQIGFSSLRYTTIYLTTSPNVSSDARLKKDIRNLHLAERRAASRMQARAYVWKDTGKMEIGYIAQEIVAAMDAEGLDAFEYGLVTKGDDGMLGIVKENINAFRLG